MHKEHHTGRTCTRNITQAGNAQGTSHRQDMHKEHHTGRTCTRSITQEAGRTCTRNITQAAHAQGTSHRQDMHKEQHTGSTRARNNTLASHATLANYGQMPILALNQISSFLHYRLSIINNCILGQVCDYTHCL
jgi:hypothetical protein